MNFQFDSKLPIIDTKWISMTNSLNSNSSPILNQIVIIAQQAIKNTKDCAIYAFNQIQKKVSETSLCPIILKINTVCTDIEKIFNIAGSAPLISFLSCPLRALLGQIQAAAGIAIITISQLALVIANFSKADKYLIVKWEFILDFGIEVTGHGCLNSIRGTAEALFANYTFGLGNIVLILPNIMNERSFTPYFSYGTLTNKWLTKSLSQNHELLESSQLVTSETTPDQQVTIPAPVIEKVPKVEKTLIKEI